MASTIGWLIVGTLMSIAATAVTCIMWRRVVDPEFLVEKLGQAVEIGSDGRDPDARRSGLRWARVVIPGFWFGALVSWPRTIDHLIRDESNVITSPPGGVWEPVVTGLLYCGLGLCVIFGFTLYYWNKPRILVHPYFKGDPGILKARRLRLEGVDVDALYEASAERWRAKRRG